MKLSFKPIQMAAKNAMESIKARQPREVARNVANAVCPEPQKYGVQFVVNKGGVLDSEIAGALVENMPKLNELAKNKKLDVKITQYGDRLAINTGVVTSYLDKAKIRDAESLYNAIEESIGTNRNRTDALLKSTMIREA